MFKICLCVLAEESLFRIISNLRHRAFLFDLGERHYRSKRAALDAILPQLQRFKNRDRLPPPIFRIQFIERDHSPLAFEEEGASAGWQRTSDRASGEIACTSRRAVSESGITAHNILGMRSRSSGNSSIRPTPKRTY